MKATTNSAYSKSVVMHRRIGSTVYLINAYVKNDAAETIEEKVLRLVKNDLQHEPGHAKISTLQAGWLSERSS
jgi:hypothetical protein